MCTFVTSIILFYSDKNNLHMDTFALEILKKHWGYDEFRPTQEPIITSILQGNDTLAMLPTGGGKSICFQVPA